MRKIILDLAVTLDGFIEGPNGEIDWLASDGETDFGDILNEILVDIGTIFYGRVSYELWGNYRPDDTASPKLKQAYDLLHSKTKYVFSTTKTTDNSQAIFINSNIEECILKILQQPGENIWLYGGGNLITTFINLGLVDVYRLAIHPAILGSGKPLFKEIKERVGLKLINTKTSTSGVVSLTYEVKKKKSTDNYKILNTTKEDLDEVLWLFKQAMTLRGKNGYKVWSDIDKIALEKDIANGLQYKIVSGNDILCIFSIQHNDPFIWRDRDQSDAIYLHRIVVNPNFKGQRQFEKVLDWATDFARQRNLKFIRMDTWADNEKIIDYYKSFGFQFIEYYKTPNANELPIQNRNLHVALLEIEFQKK
jgi:dihydrofolate reductase/ribosomal protein S18 acetylase RimI-like enzyme